MAFSTGALPKVTLVHLCPAVQKLDSEGCFIPLLHELCSQVLFTPRKSQSSFKPDLTPEYFCLNAVQ